MSELLLHNIGTILTGDLDRPVIEAECVAITDGTITAIGARSEMPNVETLVDVRGMTVASGLIDSHIHPVLGDYTPRQTAAGFLSNCLHGGVTTAISAGEVHTPGRPRDPSGVLALAVLASRSYATTVPGLPKVIAGALLLEPGLTEEHFARAAAEGVTLVGEIGVSGVSDADTAAEMVRWARAHGLRSTAHTGGASVPGSSVIDADFVVAVQPDTAAHVNGGPTALPREDVERIIEQTRAAIELVQCGNVAALRTTVESADGQWNRLIVGTDMPSGTGVIPLGMLRTVSWLASLTDLSGAQAWACATGNTARHHGLNAGFVSPGRDADLVVLDAPRGSAADSAVTALEIGDTPAVVAVIRAGSPVLSGSRCTPPPRSGALAIPGIGPGAH